MLNASTNAALLNKKPSKKNGRQLTRNVTKIDQMRAQTQLKQYGNITLDFEQIQANRQGVHSTLAHHP